MSTTGVRAHLGEYGGMAAALIALLLYFGLTTDRFFTLTNFQTITSQVPAAIIVTVGMTFVLLAGEIDLSVGSVLALCSAVMSVAMLRFEMPLPVACAAAVFTGAAIGLLNGLIVTTWSLPSFIVTLAMLEAARGLAYAITDSQTQYLGAAVASIRDAGVLGLSLAFVCALAIAVLGQAALGYTRPGRRLVAVGYNRDVAYLSGISPARTKIAVFALSGTLAGLAAVFHTARLSAADPNTGLGFELDAIAAAVIGGTSLSGGRGSVLRSLFGVFVIALLGSGLVQAGAPEHTKKLISGFVIVCAVILDQYRRSSRA